MLTRILNPEVTVLAVATDSLKIPIYDVGVFGYLRDVEANISTMLNAVHPPLMVIMRIDIDIPFGYEIVLDARDSIDILLFSAHTNPLALAAAAEQHYNLIFKLLSFFRKLIGFSQVSISCGIECFMT